jgi:hypothetical protein
LLIDAAKLSLGGWILRDRGSGHRNCEVRRAMIFRTSRPGAGKAAAAMGGEGRGGEGRGGRLEAQSGMVEGREG